MRGLYDGDGDVLLTGATGFLGMELLARYLERTDRRILAPVRARHEDEARARIGGVLELLFGRSDAYRDRVIALPGNVEREGLGLGRDDRDRVLAAASEIVHCAATVSFATALAESRRINVGGTGHLLGLAEQCAKRGILRRLVHVSTAYVAGTFEGEFSEDDLWVGQQFRNPYERSKHEAERLVRRRAPQLPAVTIVRPSIIVGESTTGWTPSFNVLYVPLRGFVRRKMRVLPADLSAPVDVVPVDHVADAIVHLTRSDEPGVSTYHLVAGERAATVAQLVDLSARLLRRQAPPIIPPAVYRAAYPLLLACAGARQREALKRVEPFLPYYTMRVRFRRDRAAQKLDPAGLRPPPLENYYHRLLDWGIHSNWSKQPLPRPGRRTLERDSVALTLPRAKRGEMPQTLHQASSSDGRQMGSPAMDRLQASIDAAETTLKDLRSELGRGSRDLVGDLGKTVRDVKRNLGRSRRRLLGDLEQIPRAVIHGTPTSQPTATRRRSGARSTNQRKQTHRATQRG